VIRIGALLHTIGLFLLALAAAMVVPLIYGLLIGDDLYPFLLSIAITGLVGLLLFKNTSSSESELTQREAVLLVFTVWIASSTFGCIPLYLSPYFSSLADAFFEATSGFTTTGATILADVEVLSNSIQFWRCFTHWLGGMGIVLLGIAVLPLVGIGGMPLYRAEFSGSKSEKLKPRIAETALALWKIYFVLSLLQYMALRWAGLNRFDALCHTFSTVATGGFSTRTASVAAFNSPLIESIIIVFMLLAGINFTLHYKLWVERRYFSFFQDVELRFYFSVVALATTATFFSLVFRDQYAPSSAFLHSLFKTTSIMTGTGLVTENYEAWSPFPQLILLALMFFGGCTGSTTGGLKSLRIFLLLKVVGREFKRMVVRRGVFVIRLGSQTYPEHTIQSLLNLVYLAFLATLAACLLLSFSGVDVFTSISAVVACIFNIGPGLGNVGPVEHYGHLPTLAKWVLSMCMVTGRLEFYTVLVIFTPVFWRR